MTDGLSSSHLGMVTIGFSQLDGKGAVIVSQEHETAIQTAYKNTSTLMAQESDGESAGS